MSKGQKWCRRQEAEVVFSYASSQENPRKNLCHIKSCYVTLKMSHTLRFSFRIAIVYVDGE